MYASPAWTLSLGAYVHVHGLLQLLPSAQAVGLQLTWHVAGCRNAVYIGLLFIVPSSSARMDHALHFQSFSWCWYGFHMNWNYLWHMCSNSSAAPNLQHACTSGALINRASGIGAWNSINAGLFIGCLPLVVPILCLGCTGLPKCTLIH